MDVSLTITANTFHNVGRRKVLRNLYIYIYIYTYIYIYIGIDIYIVMWYL